MRSEDTTSLRRHERRIIQHLLNNPKAAIWVDPGNGQIMAALTAIDLLRKPLKVGNVLVVSADDSDVHAWGDAIEEHEHLRHLSVVNIDGDPPNRLWEMEQPADIHTIRYRALGWLIDQFLREGDTKFRQIWYWDTVVLSESGCFRQQSNQSWKALFRIVPYLGRMIQLTSPPSVYGLKQIWSQIYLLDGGQRLGATIQEYRHRWFDISEIQRSRWPTLENAEEQIHDALSDIVFEMDEEDHRELPRFVPVTIKVSLSDCDAIKYRQLERKYWTELGGKRISMGDAGNLFWKLSQLANGAIYLDSGGGWVPFHRAKLVSLRNLVQSSLAMYRPVIIFYTLRSDLSLICALLERMRDITYRVYKGEDEEEAWNEGSVPVMIVHPGDDHGLKLKDGGESIVWYGLNPSLELYENALSRLDVGLERRDRSIRINHIVTEGTVDEDVMRSIGGLGAESIIPSMLRRIEERAEEGSLNSE